MFKQPFTRPFPKLDRNSPQLISNFIKYIQKFFPHLLLMSQVASLLPLFPAIDVLAYAVSKDFQNL
jgi:hypothetical protein